MLLFINSGMRYTDGMKKRTRRVIFWLAVILFGVASWVAVRYGQGYAYDWNTRTFVRTGALAVTVNTSASLYIDDREIGATSFIGSRVGRDGLLPGPKAVRVSRDGYSVWRKTATVQEGMLTDFPHVLILPTDDAAQLDLKAEASASLADTLTLKNAVVIKKGAVGEVRSGDFLLRGNVLLDARTASASEIAQGVIGFELNGNGNRLLWWTRNEIWVQWLRNTDYQPFRSEGEKQVITRFSVPIGRAAWFRDDDHVVADIGNQSYRVIETDARGGLNIIKI